MLTAQCKKNYTTFRVIGNSSIFKCLRLIVYIIILPLDLTGYVYPFVHSSFDLGLAEMCPDNCSKNHMNVFESLIIKTIHFSGFYKGQQLEHFI